MNRKQIRRAKAQIIEFLYDAIGNEYVLGARGRTDPPKFDCRGLAEQAYIDSGVGEAMGGGHMNVRREDAWAVANNRDRPATATPAACWWVHYYEPAKVGVDPKNPKALRHVATVTEPPSEENPEGLAVSALSPELGIQEHPIYPLRVKNSKGKTITLSHLAVYGYVQPAFKLVGASDVPIEDPEPPVEEPA